MSVMMKKKKEVKKEFEKEETTPKIKMGEFQLNRGCGNHYIHNHPLCSIKGKPNKRVVEEGDILICPPSVVSAFTDKFTRLDAGAKSQEELEAEEEVRARPSMREEEDGKYSVFNSQGIKLNDSPLTKSEARELLQIELDEEEEEND